ncbi:hypothetical protein HD554DRAFT_1395517 [Boletus coccyginus]|nr:hypothetical protein HD554DRAFT_1395517 [Boletus coccyginus]
MGSVAMSRCTCIRIALYFNCVNHSLCFPVMSPRRMDISSLLRDPSPPAPQRRPRSIDALLHHPDPPASLLSILNTPRHPLSPPAHRPFLRLDALVHVASEERRRITTDHDRPYPTPQPDLPSPDNPRPHKRPRDPPSPPRSPSPFLPPAHSTSPTTRHHPSASRNNNYPALRRQSILYMEPTRSAPPLLAGPVPPPVPLQHTSPFLHSLHLPQHSSPRNNSPHRHSPQHLRSQHHSSPTQTRALTPASAEADAISPRYGYGPRMAGGIEVLSNNSPSMRDPPRPDFSTYQSPVRDLSIERLVSDPYAEHATYEPTKLSPLSTRVFSLDEDRHHVKARSQQEEFFPERMRLRPPHLPFVDDSAKTTGMPTKQAEFPAQPLTERHPIRVWEEQPTAREAPRRVSPAYIPGIVCDLMEAPTWSGPHESRYGERLAEEDLATALRQDLMENVRTPPLSTRKEPQPHVNSTSEPLVSSGLQSLAEGTCIDPQPLLPTLMQPRSPTQSEPQAHLPQTPFLNSSSTHPSSASPVLDIHLKNFETHSEPQPERSETHVDASASAPLASSDPIVPEPELDADASLMASSLPRQPSPELVQPVLTLEPVTFGMSTHSTDASVSQSTSRSPSQQPMRDKDEPEDILISSPVHPEPPSRRSSEPSVSEQAMMDVDDELLSLVEDRPVRAVPAVPRVQTSSRLPLPITIGQATSAVTEQGSSGASDGPSSLMPSSQPVLKGPTLMADEEKDRASMPPPAARNKKAGKDKTTSLAVGTTTGSKKKKNGTPKPFSPPLNRNSPPNHELNPFPNPKLNPMWQIPL